MPKPVYLFADSQLLFLQTGPHAVMPSIRQQLPASDVKAAYIGAANGDAPEYFALFQAAMAQIGIHNCRAIPATLGETDADYVAQAALILLAGGDVARGWQAMQANGLDKLIPRCHAAGALLIGISAGAVQLGRCGMHEHDGSLFPTFGIVPYLIDAHDEKQGWQRLQNALQQAPERCQGIGIPSGAGVRWVDGQAPQALRRGFVKAGSWQTGC